MTHTDDKDRGGTTATMPRERIAPTRRPQRQIVRWIEFLGLMGFAAIAALGLWFLAGTDEATDGSFEVAEVMRFERIGEEAAIIDLEGLAALEDQVAGSTTGFDTAEMLRFQSIADAHGLTTLMSDGSADYAELLRFQRLAPVVVSPTLDGFDTAELARFMRIGGFEPAIDLGEFVEPGITSTGYVLPDSALLVSMQELADVYTGDHFGYLPASHWFTLEMQGLADVYTGDYFGWMPMNYWFHQEMQELADIYTGDYFGWMSEA